MASKLLQNILLHFLNSLLVVKTCSNAFCRLAAADFFMIAVGSSASRAVCQSSRPSFSPPDWQLFPAVRPCS